MPATHGQGRRRESNLVAFLACCNTAFKPLLTDWDFTRQHEGDRMSKLDEHDRDALGGSQFAFEKQRKEPLENASHVRNAVARFNQVEDVTDAERDAAWKRIQGAAKKFKVDLQESSWREIGKKPSAAGKD
jgi:hypothetical protein